MKKELVIEPKLNLCIDHGVNENDYTVATITLYFNYTLYVVYQTDNKEQIKALDEIFKVERLKDEALKIIKEKDVGIISLKEALNVNQYNNFISFRINYMDYMRLTQEEFDLLKEVFEK